MPNNTQDGYANAFLGDFNSYTEGGRIVWLYAAHNAAVKAGVAWYGPLVRDGTPLQPKNPIDIVNDLHGPVLGLYGGADTGISQEYFKSLPADRQPAQRPTIGYLARIWQHETDHLNGILLTDRMGPVAKIRNRGLLKELEEKFVPAKKAK